MKLKNNILELIVKCKESSFNRRSYSVNIDFSDFIDSLLLHTWRDKLPDARKLGNSYEINRKFNKEWLKKVTPEFQRDNDKWSKSMKVKFIENLLAGVKTELMFFRLNNSEDAQIIDGLQRTTAILDFFNGEIKPFGYSYDELKNDLNKFPCHNLMLKIYTFKKWEDVGSFYISMNENITHSKKDIQKAKDWFLAEHNILI